MPNPPPTLVSNFEVLFTPQLPPGLGPMAVAQADEFVIKGFFLTLSNPNSTAYTFTVGFHCNVNPNPVPAQRTLASAVGFLDDGTTGTPLTIRPGATAADFSVSVSVSARGTVLVGILPAFFTGTGLAPATIECRGWVDIVLPALLRSSGGKFGVLGFVAQSSTPVNVLLLPEQRLTFLPMPGDAPTAVEAQSAFALPPAGGQGALAIPPQPSRPLVFEPAELTIDPSALDLSVIGRMLDASPAQLTAMMSAMVASAPAVQDGHRTAEQMMRDLGFNA